MLHRYHHKLIALSALTLLLGACSKETPPAVKSVPVFAVEVIVEDVPLFIESTGKLGASTHVSVVPEVSGRLMEAYVKDGSLVQQGDPLFKIDSQTYEIVLRQKKAQLALSQARLDSVRKKASRHESLMKKDLISQQEWDELRAEVTSAEATVEQDLAQLESAARDLDHCTIHAPTAGRMGSTSLDIGNMVSPSQSPLTTISELNPIAVKFMLTEKEINQLSRNQDRDFIPIEVCSLCEEGLHAHGEITFIDHNFNAQTGLLSVSGKFSNIQWRFLPGQHVHIRIPVSKVLGAMVVPAKAVKINQTGPYVLVVKSDQTVEQRQVSLGEEFDAKVVIREGLQKGERVVTEGHVRLFPGAHVELMNTK